MRFQVRSPPCANVAFRHAYSTGLELALRHSQVGESIRVQCKSKFCWGAAGVRKNTGGDKEFLIPPNSDIEFFAKILSHSVLYCPAESPQHEVENQDFTDVAERESYLECVLRKTAGTRWYRYGDFSRAGRCYSKAAEFAEKALNAKLPPPVTPSLPPNLPPDVIPQLVPHLMADSDQSSTREAPPLDQRWVDVFVASLNNLAAAHLQTKQPLRAREACIKALEVMPRNITTLLRAGRYSLFGTF